MLMVKGQEVMGNAEKICKLRAEFESASMRIVLVSCRSLAEAMTLKLQELQFDTATRQYEN